MSLPTGKLPANLLRDLLDAIPADESVLVGPGIGRDAAAIRVDDEILVLKTDPITFATDDIGWYLVHINANDLACMGAEPRWLLVTALLPEKDTTPELVEQIFTDLRQAAEHVGCVLVGGHTEITEGLERAILVGNMIGVASEHGIIDPATAESGDAVLLVGGIAVEGTALLATEFADQLASKVDESTLRRSGNYLRDPGISVLEYSRTLRNALGPALRALHDPTEGGLATGLYELAEATALGIEIESDGVLVYPETQTLCDALDVDPWGLIASGSLLAVVPQDQLTVAVEAFRGSSTPIRQIGHLTGDREARTLRVGNAKSKIPKFEVDEIARLFSELE
jgi:hydrogenase expression/formation protein HypE